MNGPLVRPVRGRVIGGVCLAIANRFGWDPTLVRVGAVAAALFTGVGLPAYVVLWIVIPRGV
ncbi:MAG TPA: PspC domain-containing protein [Rhodoglobus sp.]|nr:PspC domain-containing protein [Rhodoglobus sp.]